MRKAYAVLNVKALTEADDEWVIEGIASTPTVDRMNDSVDPMGAKFALPMPLLWQHNAEKPVGRVEFAKPTTKGIPFSARIPKVKEPGILKDRIEEAVHSIKYRLVAAVSIGFQAMEDAIEQMANGGLKFKVWEWLELSLVTIPANPQATITGIKSIDTELRAALGRERQGGRLDFKSPGVSGNLQKPGTTKGFKMKSITEQINDLRVARTEKAARMKELTEVSAAEQRDLTDDEVSEFESLEAEVKGLDGEIRVKTVENMNASAARPVDGQTQRSASQSRGPTILVKKADPDEKFKGQGFTRLAIAKAAAYIAMREGNFVTPAQVAEQRWGKSHPQLVSWIKAAVAGGGTGSGEWGAELAQSDTRYNGDFIEYLYGMTVFDRLPLRSMPARVHVKGTDGAATGYWVGESKAIPATSMSASDVELTPLKVGAIAACSKELVMDSDPDAERWIRDGLAEALAQRTDTTFLSSAAAVSGVSPAGILNGLTPLVPSGADAAAVRADLMSLYAPFLAAKNAGGLVQIMTPSMAKALALLVNALGQPEFVGLNANGGTLLGDPVYTGDNVAGGDWILMKPSDIWKIGDSGIQISMSDQAMIEQNDAPQGAGDTPTAASATLMSLWQTEQVGFKVVRRINYAKRRAGAVTVLSNAEYGGVVS